MKLLLDIGNSSVNWALAEDDKFIESGAFHYTSYDIVQRLNENLLSLQQPKQVLVANVAGDDVLGTLTAWVEQQWQCECWLAKVSANFNTLKNSYTDTGQMGIDRWLAMVAAWEKYKSALFIVDCGTALTLDAIDEDGKHLGGYIIPGIELMQASLIERTGRINASPGQEIESSFANNTQAAINNGAFFTTISVIENALDNFAKELKSQPRCIISGGMAKQINSLLKEPFEHNTNLVLSGLLLLHKASE